MSKIRCADFLEGIKCPRCKSTLLTDQEVVWCSFVGSSDEYACLFGIEEKVYLKDLKEPE